MNLEPELHESASAPQLQPGSSITSRQEPARTPESRWLGESSYTAIERHIGVARRWVRDLLSGHVGEETLYDVTLCTAELTDNARKHGPAEGSVSVTVYLCNDIIRLEVTNDAVSSGVPHVTDKCFSEEGHGLQIVSSLAKGWGAYENSDLEQIVWCELYRNDLDLAPAI